MLEYFLQLDRSAICFLADEFHNALLDVLMPLLRNMNTWIPLYVLGAVGMIYRFKKLGLWWLFALVLIVSVTDLTGNYVFKKNFQRLRPCNVTELTGEIKVLVNCGSGYSFISNHAANHFAIASFVGAILTRRYRRWKYLAFFWAAAIAFAQVYVGVHYLSDVIVGALVGSLIATFLGRYLRRVLQLNF